MASSRSRQRKLARARYDRQMARRAATARRRRQLQASVGAGLALLLIVAGAVWLFGGFDRDASEPAAQPQTCLWSPQNVQANDKLKDVGQPPTADIPTEGTSTMTVTTNQGVVQIALDLADAPCAAASFTHLAGQGFFGDTPCHQLIDDGGMHALRCGDPSGTGTGGPAYTFADENVPTPPAPPSAGASAAPTPPPYPEGTVSMATDIPGTNSSQFFIYFADSTPPAGQYSVIGTVISGLDVVEKIARAGTVDNGAGQKTKPKTDVKLENLTVTGPGTAPPPAAPTPGATAPAGAGTPSATA